MKKPNPKLKPKTAKLMTQAAYARHRGLSKQRVSQLKAAGALVMAGRMVDVKASDVVLDDSPVPTMTADGEPSNLTEARYIREVFTARLRKLEYQKLSGELIPAATVASAWARVAESIKSHIGALPSRLAPELTALTDVNEVRRMLDIAVEKVLRTLAEEVRYGS